MRIVAAVLIVFCVFSSVVSAQVLSPAETLGKGKGAVLVTENHLFIDGIRLNIVYAGYIRGVSGRLDLAVYGGETNILEQDQGWIAGGANLRLFRFKGFSVSSFHVVSTGFHRRGEASTVLWNTAIVVSRNLTDSVTVWSGVNALLPIGKRQQGLFTPPEREYNVPVGVSIMLSGHLGLLVEGDMGHLKAVGVGFTIS